MKILKRDFDRAVAQPWSCGTCILNQTRKRNGLTVNGAAPQFGFTDWELANEIEVIFDAGHDPKDQDFTPDEKLTGLCILRAMLPIKL